MIGVTLVSGMIVAADTMNRSLDRQIGMFTAVDLVVGWAPSGQYLDGDATPAEADDAAEQLAAEELPADMVARLEAVAGVEASTQVATSLLAVPNDAGEAVYYSVAVADGVELEAATNLPDVAAQLEPGVILVDSATNESIADPDAWIARVLG
jgi:hypothetical protein